MGLELSNVLSDERHYGSFLCAICTNLPGLDALVTKHCGHVFCKLCWETWWKRSHKCPLCSQLQEQMPIMLQSSQPVAFRILKRIHVKCPLQHVTCNWTGEYGDLQSHLISSSAHLLEGTVSTIHEENDETMDEVDPLALAQSFKDEGNSKYSSNYFSEAIELYSKGIDVLHTSSDSTQRSLLAVLYANRAAGYFQLQKFTECRSDCDLAIQINPTYNKAYSRKSLACIELGLFDDAVTTLEEVCNIAIDSDTLKKELQKTTELRDNYQRALRIMTDQPHEANAILGKLLQTMTSSPVIVIAAAKANLLLGNTETAQRLSLQVLRRFSQYAPGFVVRGQSLCWEGDLQNGIQVLREGLRLDPENEDTKSVLRSCISIQKGLDEARKLVFHRKFQEAITAFDATLNNLGSRGIRAPIYAIIHSERAQVYLRLKNYEKAIRDAGTALYVREDLEQAWLVKTQALQALGRFIEARDELEDLLKNKWGSNSEAIRKAFERADFLVRKEQRPDYYELLGLSSIASLMEIKKQYKVKAMEYHPDKWMTASEEQRKDAEGKFQLLGEALEILSDDFQRQLYDEGFDPEAIRERVAAAQRAAHRSQNHYHR
jgi:DnaJ homolog subfamily C member 7